MLKIINSKIKPSKGVGNMAGNLRNWDLSGGSSLPRGCLPPRARILTDLMSGNMTNGIGGVGSNDLKSSYVPDGAEILGGSDRMAGYNRGKDQADIALKEKPAMQGMTPTQDMQNANSMDDTVNGKENKMGRDKNDAVYLQQREVYDNRMNFFDFSKGVWNGNNDGGQNEGDDDNSLISPWTVIHDAQMKTKGDTRNPSEGYHGQDFSQFGAGAQILGLSTVQTAADGGTQYGDIRRPREEDVARDFFTSNSVEDGLIVKPPFSDFKDNIKLIEQIEKQYKDKIEFGLTVAKNAAPSIVIDLAEKGAMLLPPPIKGGALAVIVMIDIGLAVYEVYDEWEADVRAYEQKHGCSREVAEQKVGLLKDSLDAFMSFSMTKWTKYVLDSIDISADIAIDIISAVLQAIPEEKLKEWGRTIREWRRENVDPYFLY